MSRSPHTARDEELNLELLFSSCRFFAHIVQRTAAHSVSYLFLISEHREYETAQTPKITQSTRRGKVQ